MGDPRNVWLGGRNVLERAWFRWAELLFCLILITASSRGFSELLGSLPPKFHSFKKLYNDKYNAKLLD